MSIRGLTSLIPTYGLGVDGTIKRIPDWLLDFDLQEKSGLVSLADNVAVPLGRNVVINGDMEAGDPPTNWVTDGDGTLSSEAGTVHSGTASLKFVKGTGAGIANRQWYYQITNLSIGKTYTINSWVYLDSAAPPSLVQMLLGTGSQSGFLPETDTTSVQDTWTNLTFDFTATATTMYIVFINNGIDAQGVITYTDDVTVKQTDILASSAYSPSTDNPLTGDHTGVAVGQPGQYRVTYVVTDDGASTYTDFLSAEYNSIYDPTTDFTKFSVMRKTTWDTTERFLFHDYVDANNYIAIRTTTVQDQVAFDFMAGGTLEQILWDSGGSTDLMLLDLGRESGVFKARVNGVNVGSEAIAGTFVGNFTIMVGGAENTTPTKVHLGSRAWMDNFSSYVSDADALRIKNSMGIPG